MVPKTSSFFLLLNIFVGVCHEMRVQQDPVVNVTEGETAHLRCHFNITGDSRIGSFRWYKGALGGKDVTNDSHPTGIIKVDPDAFSRNNYASIYILETLVQYQDIYYCEVDVFGEKGTGNGTQLIVRRLIKKRPANSHSEITCQEEEEEGTWTIIRIVLFTLLAVLSIPLTFLVHQRRE